MRLFIVDHALPNFDLKVCVSKLNSEKSEQHLRRPFQSVLSHSQTRNAYRRRDPRDRLPRSVTHTHPSTLPTSPERDFV